MARAGAGASFLYKQGEDVLAYHGPLIHEAKVTDTISKEAPDGKTKVKLYLLHYSGYASHWDEWVPESRVLKNSDENRARQKERVKEFQRAHKRKRTEAAASSAAAKAKAAKADEKASGGGSDEKLLEDIKEHLRLPHGAKLKLIEDWEHITREKKLVPLPAATPIETLLQEFYTAKARRTSHERLYGEVCDGVKLYFNQALPTILLYKYERRQHREAKEKHKGQAPHEYYGAEHLLRLFVKLPELLAKCNMQKEHMTVLVSKLAELLKFLVSQKGKYFADAYESPDSEYLAWWSSSSE
jgi:mortality factor 4-like protein 1